MTNLWGDPWQGVLSYLDLSVRRMSFADVVKKMTPRPVNIVRIIKHGTHRPRCFFDIFPKMFRVEFNQRENCERLPRNGKTISQATQNLPTTEGEHPAEVERSLTTRVESKTSQRQEFLAMRTVPVILINGNRRMTVNALLDDASTKTYINADVAAELGLQGNLQRTNVNVDLEWSNRNISDDACPIQTGTSGWKSQHYYGSLHNRKSNW